MMELDEMYDGALYTLTLEELERRVFGESHKPGATKESRLWDLLNPGGNYLTDRLLDLFAEFYSEEGWSRGYNYHNVTCTHSHKKDEE